MRHLTREALTDHIARGAPLAGIHLRRGVDRVVRAPDDADVAMVREQLGDDATKGRLVPFIISTEERASDGHTLRAAGWELGTYKRNPVVLWSHDRKQPRIGDSVVEVRGNVLRSVASFLPREQSELAWSLGEVAATRGHAASVGFGILEAQPAPAEVRKTIPWALDCSRQELDEWSLVNIGADAGALAQRADPKRLLHELEEMLDGADIGDGHRKAILRIWRAARAKKRAEIVIISTGDDCDDASGEGDAMDTQEGAPVDDGAAPPVDQQHMLQCPRCSHRGSSAEFSVVAGEGVPANEAPPGTEQPIAEPFRGVLTAQLVEPGPSPVEKALRGVLAGL